MLQLQEDTLGSYKIKNREKNKYSERFEPITL